MEILLLWILFGICAAMAAGSKGRSQFGWFCLGILFGPFGLLFAILAKDLKVVKEAADMKVCPVCAESIKVAALKCRYCGKEFDPKQVKLDVMDQQLSKL